MEVAEEAQQLAGARGGEAAEALVPEQEEAGGGGDLLDDGVESFLLGGVGDLVEAVVEGDEGAEAGVLLEVGEGDVVDVDEGWGEGLAAEEAAEGAAGVGRRS